jgi:hypothetical protein
MRRFTSFSSPGMIMPRPMPDWLVTTSSRLPASRRRADHKPERVLAACRRLHEEPKQQNN